MPEAQIFRYETPSADFEVGRKNTKLCQTDRIVGAVQLIRKGGETHMHSHPHLDGLWMVLSGKARFYGEGPNGEDQLLGEFGKHEGVLIPRNFRYWFETASDEEPLELLQVEASDVPQEKFFSGKATNIIDRQDALVATVPQG
jgi:mannose-6-phosphate isomerase-like protein (cupin superfamily)